MLSSSIEKVLNTLTILLNTESITANLAQVLTYLVFFQIFKSISIFQFPFYALRFGIAQKMQKTHFTKVFCNLVINNNDLGEFSHYEKNKPSRPTFYFNILKDKHSSKLLGIIEKCMNHASVFSRHVSVFQACLDAEKYIKMFKFMSEF